MRSWRSSERARPAWTRRSEASLADVRVRGDEALIEYTARFDRTTVTAETLRIGAPEIEAAWQATAPETLAALELAAERIEAFHRRQLPADESYLDAHGNELGQRWRAIAAVGLYVPGGTAAYPSSLLMNAVPARVAGVERLAVAVPTPDGAPNPLVLAGSAPPRDRRDLSHRRGPGHRRAGLRQRQHRPGRQDRRPRQRLRRRGQAPGLRHRRHRPDRRPVGDPGGGRWGERSRLDRRRPVVPGRARRGGAGHPDQRRRRIRRAGDRRHRDGPGWARARRDRPRQLAEARCGDPGLRPPGRGAGADRPDRTGAPGAGPGRTGRAGRTGPEPPAPSSSAG